MSIREAGSYRGVEEHEIANRNKTFRDVRKTSEKFYDFLNSTVVALFLLLSFAILAVIFPALFPLSLIFILVFFKLRYSSVKKQMLVGRLPKSSGMKDLGDPIPGTDDTKHFKANGIFYVGKDRKSKQELWLADKDVLTHMLIFGTTGAGKTETLVSLTYNAIALGSGLFYTDPKAAPKLAFQIFTMARLLGREHDFLVVNYSVKQRSPYKHNPKKITNTMNPFSMGNAESLAEVLSALLPVSDGDNAVFSNAAQTMIKSLMYGLVEKRNKKELALSVATIREYTALDKYIEIATDESLSKEAQNAMQSYLRSVGWKENMAPQKLQDVSRQHGFSLSYFSLPLAYLTDTYGHIYLKAKGEVDSFDIIKYRRIAVILLPALEMSPNQLKNVGQITLSSIRNACALGLGERLEGFKVDVVDALPTNSPVPDINIPFLSVTDEYAAIPTAGYAEVLTQGRGLGIAAIVASQDYAGIKGADEKGAKQIVANTKLKMIMAMDDPEDTWELVKNISGEVEVTVTSGYDAKETTVGNYKDNASTSLEKRSRVDLMDLQSQIEGEFHGFFKGKLIRGQSFYADPPIDSQMFSLNEKVGIEDIDKAVIERNYGEIKEMTDNFIELVENGGISKKRVKELTPLNDKHKRILKGFSVAFEEVEPRNRKDKTILALMMAQQFLKTSKEDMKKLIQKKNDITSRTDNEESKEDESTSPPNTSKNTPTDEDDDDIPMFNGISLNDGNDEEDDGSDVDYEDEEVSRASEQVQTMTKGIIRGVNLTVDPVERQDLTKDIRTIEKETNPNYTPDMPQKIVEENSIKLKYEAPLPEKAKPEEDLNDDVNQIINIVQSKISKKNENENNEDDK